MTEPSFVFLLVIGIVFIVWTVKGKKRR